MAKEPTPLYMLTEFKTIPPTCIGYFTIEQLGEYVAENYPLDADRLKKWMSVVKTLDKQGDEAIVYIHANWTLEAMRLTKSYQPKMLPIIRKILTTDPCPVYNDKIPSWIIKDLSATFSIGSDDAHRMVRITDRILIHFHTIDEETAAGKLYMMINKNIICFTYTQNKNGNKAIWNGKIAIDTNERGIITKLNDLTECVRILNDSKIKGFMIDLYA